MALRRDNALYCVHSDHLGSTSVLTDASGQEVPNTRLRYYPYGDPRPDSAVPTHNAFATGYSDATFTGQRRDVGTGLYFYGARYYDSAIGRFLQPDTIVPEPRNPQSLNRYSYANNNPVRYIDNNGHCGPLTPVCLALLLGGMAFLLQGDSPDLNVTPEDVASQQLGGALFVGGAGLTLGAGIAGLGTQAATAACADGDCTNEVRGAGQVAQNAAKAAESGVRLRQQYESAVRGLSEKADQMRAAGKSAEEIARSLHAERRALGEQFKAMTPPDALEQIYARNFEKYGDRLGPSIEWLIQRGLNQGKSMDEIWNDIIESASRSGGKDILPQLLDK
jgi:RHS repeat-associated protein